MLAVNKEDAILFNIVVKNIFSSLQLDQKLIFAQANDLVGLCLVKNSGSWSSLGLVKYLQNPFMKWSNNIVVAMLIGLKLDKVLGSARHLWSSPFQFLPPIAPYRILNLKWHCFDFV